MDLLQLDRPQGRELERLPERAAGAIARLGSLFPEAVQRERVTGGLGNMAGHEWELPYEREEGRRDLMGMAAALALRSPNQAMLHFARAEDRFLYDYSNKAIRLAGERGLALKPFARLSRPPGGTFRIRGPEHEWLFRDLEAFAGTVPAEILWLAAGLKRMGLEWQRTLVGEPYVPPAPRVVRQDGDPVFCVMIGNRWLLEVARW